jgi:dipeptidyl aminopeptidase/acylaminoacyl peptidase
VKAYLVAAVAACVAMSAEAAPPPASAFGRVPAVIDAEISPNGQRIAMLGGTSEQRVVSIATIDQPGLPVLQLGSVEGVGVRWAGDDFVLARIAFWESFGPRNSARFERNVVVTPQAKAVTRLLETDNLSAFLTNQPIYRITTDEPPQAMVVGLLERGAMNNSWDTRLKRKSEDVVVALWKADPASGKGVIVERGTPDTLWWSVDAKGEPRVRVDLDQINRRFSVLARSGVKGQWRELWGTTDTDSRRLYYGYSEASDSIYVHRDGELWARKVSDGAEVKVGQTSGQPSLELVWDEHSDALVGLSTGAERPSIEWLDTEIGSAHGVLARAFKGKNVALHSWSKDRNRFVARVSGPLSPAVWYLYDRARKEISPIGDEYPELKDAAFGTTRWITYKARDGLDINAYLTLPPGLAAGAKPPLVVLPHGGPTSRDRYDFDYMVQFLATRGYAVLQPQFRGSWGFGRTFEKAGEGEWGGKMQTDLQDGVAALVKDGQVDASRACIVGASFGGYSALAGAALYPDAYRCAVSIAGISDLGQLLIEEGRTYGREGEAIDQLRKELGAASSGKLGEHSPARHAAEVKAPVLLIHGDKDTVVSIEQSQLMTSRLKAAGKDVQYIVLEGENHYLTKTANRTRTLQAIETFLAKHLPVN